jgi:hypothetical protein
VIDELKRRSRTTASDRRLAYARYVLARRNNDWALHELGRAMAVGKEGAPLDLETGRALMALGVELGSSRGLLALGRSYDPNLYASDPEPTIAAAYYHATLPFPSPGEQARRLLRALTPDPDWQTTLLDNWPAPPVTLEAERQPGER